MRQARCWKFLLFGLLCWTAFDAATASNNFASHVALHFGSQVDRWTSSRKRSATSADSRLLNLPLSPDSPHHNPPIQNPPRGGASLPDLASKTMTAAQMETFQLFSGGIAGTFAATLTNPLEVIKTQLQSSLVTSGDMATGRGHPTDIARRIMAQDGLSGFFRGLPPTLIGIIPSRSAYFYVYQRIKGHLGPYLPEGSPPNALTAGFIAGIVSNSVTNPIWMVRTRMQLLIDTAAGQRAYKGYVDAISSIFREEGIGGFYKGIFASYWGCTEGALQFLIYEQFKTRLLRRQNISRAKQGLPASDELPKRVYFCTAATAKLIAAIATYPHEVARTRLREQARGGVFKYHGMWQTLGLIAAEEGKVGLYSGMGMHLLKVVPNSALMFLTYEVVRSWLGGFTIVQDGPNADGPLISIQEDETE